MLEMFGITKVFGGLTALEDVTLTIRRGSITGIIGPNGAGKTTLFNIISGIYVQTSGEVRLEDKKISGLMPEELAKLGLMRTFQNVELFGQMSVLENVMVGLHTKGRSGFISCALKLPGEIREEKASREKALHWLEYVGLAEAAELRAASLPFGKGRLLEIARALAVEPRLILLDEPAAGLNSRETFELAGLIRKVRDSGITIALVEHDMDLVMDICDPVIVLNLGRKLAEGTPREIQENAQVVTAYLGEG